MRFSHMIDMAISPLKAKDDIAKLYPGGATAITAPADKPTVAKYPYGLCLRFDEDDLKKLGLEGLPEVGDTIHIAAFAKVTSAREDERETADGETKNCRNVELQITHLGVEDEDDETRSQKWYKEEADADLGDAEEEEED